MIKIYIHTNLINNKMYAGQTSEENVEDRWNDGFTRTYNQHLRSAYKKYGKDNFKSIVVNETESQEEADLLEQYYIEKFNLLDPNFGYNKTNGGKYFTYLSEETKKKISNSIKNSKVFLENNADAHEKKVVGMHIRTGEIFKFKSQKDAGRYFNISPCAIGNSCTGRIKTAANIVWRFDDENFEGFDFSKIKNIRKCSEERKKKISSSQKGRKGQITRSTPIIGFDIENNKYQTFETSIEAARMLGIHCVKVNKTKNEKRITKGWYFIKKESFDQDFSKEFKNELLKLLHDPRRYISSEGLKRISEKNRK